MLSLGLRLIRFLPKAHPSGFVYVARLPSAPFPPGTDFYDFRVLTRNGNVHGLGSIDSLALAHSPLRASSTSLNSRRLHSRRERLTSQTAQKWSDSQIKFRQPRLPRMPVAAS